jgi:putative transposase
MRSFVTSGEGKIVVGGLALAALAGPVEHANGPQTEAELAALRRCVQRGSPFGEGAWCDQLVRRLGLESTLRPQGRRKKRENGS